jgi:NADPH:quinone reductase-like Zn-dependent oxidoreductase
MHAAVVRDFEHPPRYGELPMPQLSTDEAVIVTVHAVGLHPRVRSGASGKHYTSSGRLPLVPGVDAVGELANGSLVYFVADDASMGTMAEFALVDPRRTIPLPAHIDQVTVAAAMNPAMSAWVAMRRRVPLQPGQEVLVLGATGSAGTMAVQVAKLLGAGKVVGVGRDRQRLDALLTVGADEVVQLSEDRDITADALATAACDVDLVIDYLWGPPAETTIMDLLTRRRDRSKELNWIQIGSIGGPTIQLPSVALRSANFRLLGNGQGAVSTMVYLEELPALVQEIDKGNLSISTQTQLLCDVEQVWAMPEASGVRTVFVTNKSLASS